MESKNLFTHALREDIIMLDSELPINFIEHNHNKTGPFCILHWHNEIELVFVKKGIVTLIGDNKNIDAKSGEILFVNSNEIHGYTIKEAPVVLFCCTVNPSLLQGRYISSYDHKFISVNNQITVFNNIIKEDSELIDFFINMWEIGKEKKVGHEYYIKSNLFGIMAVMIKNHINKTISNHEYLSQEQNLSSINKVLKYIEHHYFEDMTLAELSKLLNISKHYFCRFFKEIVGSTPMEYVNNYRVHQAIFLMRDKPDLLITQIACQVGFDDPNYFSRVFKNVTGTSPKKYKTTNKTLSRKYNFQ